MQPSWARQIFKARKKGGVAEATSGHRAGTETWGQTEQLRSGRLTLLERTCTDETRWVTGAGGFLPVSWTATKGFEVRLAIKSQTPSRLEAPCSSPSCP